MLQCEHENDQNSSCGQHRGREGVHPTGAAGFVMELTTVLCLNPRNQSVFLFYNISNIFGKDIVFSSGRSVRGWINKACAEIH